jgi:hypothetical protein
LLDIGRHRQLGREFVECCPQCPDIRAGVEPALAQDRIQLELLLFAHQVCTSFVSESAGAGLHYVEVAPLEGARSIQ